MAVGSRLHQVSLLRFLLSGVLLQTVLSTPLFPRDVKAGSITVEQGVHQAVALAAMTLLFTAHRAVMNSGFTLSRQRFTTDVILGLCITLLSTLWTSLVIISGFVVGDKPCWKGVSPCLARTAFSPWLLQILCVFWLISLWDAVHFSEVRRTSEKAIGLWKLDSANGPYSWAQSMNKIFLRSLYFCVFLAIAATSYGAISQGFYTMGFLNLVGLALFIGGAAGGRNTYCDAPHICKGDMVRIPLHTSHLEGTVYILPSRGYGFDAVWSSKVEFEHRDLDSAMKEIAETIRVKDGNFQSPALAIRAILTPFTQRVNMTIEQLIDLAEWLYLDPKSKTSGMQSFRCTRAPGIHLIGTNLSFALCHAEHLVFMGRHRLPPHLQDNLRSLRNMKHSGVGSQEEIHTIGFSGGLAGYHEAVRYVYSLLGEKDIDATALHPGGTPPLRSCVLSSIPLSIEEYAARLWDVCIDDAESTFVALYMFTNIWSMDVGHIQGFHPFPLRCRSRQGDVTNWGIVWRQAWYQGVIAQLTTLSPVILGAFLAGILS